MTTPIPQPPGIPLLGNIFDINPSNTWASLKILAEKYGEQIKSFSVVPRSGPISLLINGDSLTLRLGEIFQVKVLGKTIVFVAGAALAGELCDEKRFRKFVGGPIVEIRHTVHDSLFTAFDHEASWGIAHRIIAPQLAPGRVADMFDEMRDATVELVRKWQGGQHSHTGAVNRISPIDELNRLNLEVTARTLFGTKLGCLTGPEHPAIRGMEDATSEAMKRPTRPGFLNWLVYGGKFNRATDTLRSWAAEMVSRRKESLASPSSTEAGRRDLLWALLNAQDPETGKSFTESQVIDEIVTMPIGSSTAPGLLSSALYYLAENPEVVVRARRELDGVVGRGKPLRHAHMARLRYVEAVLRESMRLTFPAPGFNIEPIPRADPADRSPVLLGGGRYAVAHNQAMIIVLAGVNRDPTVFENPLAFIPERMMDGDGVGALEKLPLGAQRWFGNGKRECIGKHWAHQFCFVVLATLMWEFDFEKADPDYELKQDGWFNLRPIDFYVKVRPRAD